MSFVLESVLRSSLVLAIGLAAVALLGTSPPPCGTGCLMATLVLAAAQPAMNRIVPGVRTAGARLGGLANVEKRRGRTEVEFERATADDSAGASSQQRTGSRSRIDPGGRA